MSDSIRDLKLTIVGTGSDLIVGYAIYPSTFDAANKRIGWWVAKLDPALGAWAISLPDVPNVPSGSGTLDEGRRKQISDLVLNQLPKLPEPLSPESTNLVVLKIWGSDAVAGYIRAPSGDRWFTAQLHPTKGWLLEFADYQGAPYLSPTEKDVAAKLALEQTELMHRELVKSILHF